MLEYMHDSLEKIYEKDPLSLKQAVKEFLNAKMI